MAFLFVETELELLFTSNVLAAGEPSRSASLCVNVCLGDGIIFRCPVAMLRAGSRTLAELLDGTKGEEVFSGRAELPLPSLDSALFKAVALYLEHFYGFAVEGNTLDGNLPTHTPTPLSRPLQVQELYTLSNWEHSFVVQQLLLWPRDKWGLCVDGKWVDVSGASLSDVCLADHQRSLQRVLSLLEASTELDILPLRDLCGAVIANMLLDLDEKDMFGLMGVAESLGHEEERTLLKEYPWLNL